MKQTDAHRFLSGTFYKNKIKELFKYIYIINYLWVLSVGRRAVKEPLNGIDELAQTSRLFFDFTGEK